MKFQNPNNKEKHPKRIQRMKNTLSQEEHQTSQEDQTSTVSRRTTNKQANRTTANFPLIKPNCPLSMRVK